MEPGETLGIAAQIAVALAGFASVVVVFGRVSTHEWSPIDKFRLWQLLANSILPLAFCMIGLLLLAIRPALAGVWRWCSGARIRNSFAVLHRVGESFSPVGSAKVAALGRSSLVFLSLRSSRDCSDAIAIVQRCPS
jgi:hypothetical protein